MYAKMDANSGGRLSFDEFNAVVLIMIASNAACQNQFRGRLKTNCVGKPKRRLSGRE